MIDYGKSAFEKMPKGLKYEKRIQKEREDAERAHKYQKQSLLYGAIFEYDELYDLIKWENKKEITPPLWILPKGHICDKKVAC